MAIKTHGCFVCIKDPYFIREYLLENMNPYIKRRLSKDNDSTVHNLITGAKEIQHFNPSGPGNSPSIHQIYKLVLTLEPSLSLKSDQQAKAKRKAKLPTVIGLNLSLQNINESSTSRIVASFTISDHKQIQVEHSAFTSMNIYICKKQFKYKICNT